MTTAKLYALSYLSYLYHSGQFYQTYSIGCRAEKLLLRRGIAHPIDQVESRQTMWPEGFKKEYFKHFRHYLPMFQKNFR